MGFQGFKVVFKAVLLLPQVSQAVPWFYIGGEAAFVYE
jgi:hypothetical protein